MPIDASEYISLDELLEVAAETTRQPGEASLVLQPPCRAQSRIWWDMTVTPGNWKHTWQAAVLLVVLGIVTPVYYSRAPCHCCYQRR